MTFLYNTITMSINSRKLINNIYSSLMEKLKLEFLHIVERERERERERVSLLIAPARESFASQVSFVWASFASPVLKIYDIF